MKKFDNFCMALENLKEINNYSKPFDTVTKTGLVALFEICFEQAWKAMKESLEVHGFDGGKTGSPRMTIKLAYAANMIEDEEIWLKALSARNNVARSYNEAVALDIIKNTREIFLKMFLDLKENLKNNWIELD